MIHIPEPQSTETNKGVVELATQAEVDEGTDAQRVLTPQTFVHSKFSKVYIPAPEKEKKFKNLTYKFEATVEIPSEYNSYSGFEYRFWLEDQGSTDLVSIQIVDFSDGAILGSLTGVAINGEKIVPLTKPTVFPTTIEISLKKDTDLSADLLLKSGVLILTP